MASTESPRRAVAGRWLPWRRALVVACWLCLGLLISAAVLREAMPERSRWLILLAALTPVLYLPAWLVAVVAAGTRKWGMLCVALVLVAFHVWWVAPLVVGGRGTISDPAATLTVLGINLEANRSTGAATSRLFDEAQPDLVVISEASPLSTAGLRTRSFPFVVSDVRDGTAGWMVLSRWPVLTRTQLDLGDRVMPRLVLKRPDGGQLILWQVHPIAPIAGDVGQWRRQLVAIRRAIDSDRHAVAPVLVVGDFNATRDLPEFRAILHDGWADAGDGHGLMAPGRVGGRTPPMLRLDHILLSNNVGVRGI